MQKQRVGKKTHVDLGKAKEPDKWVDIKWFRNAVLQTNTSYMQRDDKNEKLQCNLQVYVVTVKFWNMPVQPKPNIYTTPTSHFRLISNRPIWFSQFMSVLSKTC